MCCKNFSICVVKGINGFCVCQKNFSSYICDMQHNCILFFRKYFAVRVCTTLLQWEECHMDRVERSSVLCGCAFAVKLVTFFTIFLPSLPLLSCQRERQIAVAGLTEDK